MLQLYLFLSIVDYFIAVKDVFGCSCFSIDLFYIYIYCRKFNADFNKVLKTVGHRAS